MDNETIMPLLYNIVPTCTSMHCAQGNIQMFDPHIRPFLLEKQKQFNSVAQFSLGVMLKKI